MGKAITGLPPAPDQIRAFLADSRDTRIKRDELVDRLIGSPDYVDFWANKWADLLQCNSKFLGSEGAELFRAWIRKEVEKNTPYDQFVHKVPLGVPKDFAQVYGWFDVQPTSQAGGG